MMYFIVNAQYDECFELFFKDELGYPNFYRLAELLPSYYTYTNVILVAPHVKTPAIAEKIAAKIQTLGIPYHPFNPEIETTFVFDAQGTLDTHPLFQKALEDAIITFLQPEKPCQRASF